MSCVWDRPVVTKELATAVRLVDAFTSLPLERPFDVRITGHEWWTPQFATTNHTYRFVVTNALVPPLGTVGVTVTPRDVAAAHADVDALTIEIPAAGAAPVPLTSTHYLVEHALWPTRAFRPPPGETFIRGRVERAGVPLGGHRVQLADGAAPAPLRQPRPPTPAAGSRTACPACACRPSTRPPWWPPRTSSRR